MAKLLSYTTSQTSLNEKELIPKTYISVACEKSTQHPKNILDQSRFTESGESFSIFFAHPLNSIWSFNNTRYAITYKYMDLWLQLLSVWTCLWKAQTAPEVLTSTSGIVKCDVSVNTWNDRTGGHCTLLSGNELIKCQADPFPLSVLSIEVQQSGCLISSQTCTAFITDLNPNPVENCL